MLTRLQARQNNSPNLLEVMALVVGQVMGVRCLADDESRQITGPV